MKQDEEPIFSVFTDEEVEALRELIKDRLEKNDFVDEEEFMKDSPLNKSKRGVKE